VAWIPFRAMHRPMPEPKPTPWRASARHGSVSMALWAFGLATTLLLLGLWGRAVANDEPAVLETARAVVNAETASDRIYTWMEDGIVSATDIDPSAAERAISELRGHPEVEAAVGSLVDQFVGALFASEGEETLLDYAAALTPVVPLVASGLAAQDIAVDEAVLVAVLAEAEPIDLETGDIATVIRAVEDAKAILSLIVVLSAATLMVTGTSALWLSTDKLAMARTLAMRVVLSALSFAILFRVGSWALDPQRGGSPIAGAGSILLASNANVFLIAALGASLFSVMVGLLLWRRGETEIPVGTDTADADTKELISI
jgi:hypothetical protein